jgi:hypothetical protein
LNKSVYLHFGDYNFEFKSLYCLEMCFNLRNSCYLHDKTAGAKTAASVTPYYIERPALGFVMLPLWENFGQLLK